VGRIGPVNVCIAGVFYQVTDGISLSGGPVTTPVTNLFTDRRITSRIERQDLSGAGSLHRQYHIDRGRVRDWSQDRTTQGFRILLVEDGLLI
jgi:hypothetical protein